MITMRNYNQWVLWSEKERSGKKTKVPLGKNGRATNVTNPACWKSFDQVLEEKLEHPELFDGIGFCFSENDPYLGIDLDDVKKWYGWEEIIEKLDSYTETSPSGNGYHIIVVGFIPGEINARKIGSHETGGIEMYDSERYFTVTLDPLEGREEIKKNQEGINWLFHTIDDKGLISKLMSKPYAKKLQLLWENRFTLAGYASQSEADLSFVRILSNNGAPIHQIDRIFRHTALYRTKWDEKRGNTTYGKMTLEKGTEENKTNI